MIESLDQFYCIFKKQCKSSENHETLPWWAVKVFGSVLLHFGTTGNYDSAPGLKSHTFGRETERGQSYVGSYFCAQLHRKELKATRTNK